eukprot:9454622-Pyramimonas_sp.AAC.3
MANDALKQIWGGKGHGVIQACMYDYDDDYLACLLLKVTNMVDSSGAARGRFQLEYTHDITGVAPLLHARCQVGVLGGHHRARAALAPGPRREEQTRQTVRARMSVLAGGPEDSVQPSRWQLGLQIRVHPAVVARWAEIWRSFNDILLTVGFDGIAPAKCFIHLVLPPEMQDDGARHAPRCLRALGQPEIQLRAADISIQKTCFKSERAFALGADGFDGPSAAASARV